MCIHIVRDNSKSKKISKYRLKISTTEFAFQFYFSTIMVWKIFRKFNDDVKCLPKRIPNYWEMFCPTFGPCRGICKPFIKTREDVKDCKNCCAYCIKTSSVTKMERDFLKHRKFDKAHYLSPGAMCVVKIEEKYLRSQKERKKAEKKACDELLGRRKRRFCFRRKVERPRTPPPVRPGGAPVRKYPDVVATESWDTGRRVAVPALTPTTTATRMHPATARKVNKKGKKK